jgi:hypothetical protein
LNQRDRCAFNNGTFQALAQFCFTHAMDVPRTPLSCGCCVCLQIIDINTYLDDQAAVLKAFSRLFSPVNAAKNIFILILRLPWFLDFHGF